MKKIIIYIIIAVFGVVLLVGGAVFGSYMYNSSIPHFDVYGIGSVYIFHDGESLLGPKELQEEGYVINHPYFWNAGNYAYTYEMMDCYDEVESACRDYAMFVARKYENKAKLDAAVDYTPEILTIRFTGTGYLEDGTEENLDRTYIFDIDGAGKERLPKLLNKNEIFPQPESR